MIAIMLVCWVVGISDGDSLTTRCGPAGLPRQVRIHGIDAPERHQPFHDAARNRLADLCLQATARIQQVELDRYGRTVGQVECRGQDAAAHQVRGGAAWVYDRYAQGRDDLRTLQRHAQSTRRGLWADAHPIPPWEWRRH